MTTHWMRRLVSLAAITACAPALATNILFLSTYEGGRRDGLAAVTNAYNAINLAKAPTDTVVDGRDWLNSSSALDPAAVEAADIIMVMTVYSQIEANRYDELASLMLTRPDKTMVVFTDGCCQQATNIDRFMATLKTATGWNVAATYVSGNSSAPLNTASPYAGGFTVNPMIGGHYGRMSDVPGENALYLVPGAPTPKPTDRVNAYGFFIPQSSMNGGQGACTFLVGDASPFPNASQANAIVADFLRAATDVNGACKVTQSAVADLQPAITGSATVDTGAVSTLTVAVNNLGGTASPDGQLTVTLPPGLRVAGTLPAGCVLQPGATPTTDEVVTCTLPVIAEGDATSFALPVEAEVDGSHDVTAVVSGVTDENVTSNNSASFTLTAATPVNPPVTTAQPVPALGWPMLAALGALLPWVARRRRQPS